MEASTTYFEDLAATGIVCPHTDAIVPDGEKIFFRYIKGGTISSDNFLPTTIKTDIPLPDGFDDCIAKSVSVYDDMKGLLNGVFRLPHNIGKKKKIGVIKLKATDGVFKQTFDNKNHHSWWRSKAFDFTTVTIQEITV